MRKNYKMDRGRILSLLNVYGIEERIHNTDRCEVCDKLIKKGECRYYATSLECFGEYDETKMCLDCAITELEYEISVLKNEIKEIKVRNGGE